MQKFFKFWSYYLPLPLYGLLLFWWTSQSMNRVFTLFVFILPVAYGYITPYIATTIMKKWKFTGGLKIGEIYFHQGFKIAANLILWLSIAIIDLDTKNILSITTIVKLSLFVGTLQSLIIWIHDIYALRFGTIEMSNELYLSGAPAEVVAFQFAPATFFILGFSFSGLSLAFLNHMNSGAHMSGMGFVVSICVALTILNLLVSVVYKVCEQGLQNP